MGMCCKKKSIIYMHIRMPSVLWCCRLGGRKGIRPVKTECWSAGVVQICIWPSWCHCHPQSLAPVKYRLVLPSGAGSLGQSRTKGHYNRCCCRCSCCYCCIADAANVVVVVVVVVVHIVYIFCKNCDIIVYVIVYLSEEFVIRSVLSCDLFWILLCSLPLCVTQKLDHCYDILLYAYSKLG